MKAGVSYDGWRTSIAWRSGRSSSVVVNARPSIRSSCLDASAAAAAVVRGSSARKSAIRPASKPRFGRQLPEHGPELGPQSEHARGEEVGQRRLDVAQLLHVRDEPAALHREDEVLRGAGPPVLVALGPSASA